MKKFGLAVLLLALMSCGSGRNDFSGDTLRAGDNLPEAFNTPEGVTHQAKSCLSPLMDPRSGTEIRFVRTMGELGDYKAPAGAYGLKRNELLRINCETGEILGVVKR